MLLDQAMAFAAGAKERDQRDLHLLVSVVDIYLNFSEDWDCYTVLNIV